MANKPRKKHTGGRPRKYATPTRPVVCTLPAGMVKRIDKLAGPGKRSEWIAAACQWELDCIDEAK